ncbi:MAG: hypothetical protein COA74_08600 [Gammaproteobacteria bacterium]|nr:MAG: hypothetical protein COA74_08600 [Gammaproteobacteria bacterium]
MGKFITVLIASIFIFVWMHNLEAAKKSRNSKHSKSAVISKKSCSSVDKKINHLNSKLRAGYSLKKGEVMKEKLRRLDKKKYACGRKRFVTK